MSLTESLVTALGIGHSFFVYQDLNKSYSADARTTSIMLNYRNPLKSNLKIFLLSLKIDKRDVLSADK
jgi:hypothetical protein